MKRKNWEIIIAGKLADRYRAPTSFAEAHAAESSRLAPKLTVVLREGWGNNTKFVSTLRKGNKVKA